MRGTAGSGARSVATEEYVEPLPPGTPDYSDASSISIEDADGWDTETSEVLHMHYPNETDRLAAFGANRSDL